MVCYIIVLFVQASENLASSVTEGVLSLLRNLHFSEFIVQHQEIVIEDVLSEGNVKSEGGCPYLDS